MAKKPTEAQRRVLEAMLDGRTLHWLGGLTPTSWLSDPQETARVHTVLALEYAGWIKREGEHARFKFTLTPLGLSALRAHSTPTKDDR